MGTTYSFWNPNPHGKRVGDCTVRALSRALRKSWEETYICLCLQGLEMADMPSSDAVWGAYLRDNGFVRRVLPDDCPVNYTVDDFCHDNPHGIFILSIAGQSGGHVICVEDGKFYDSWNSSDELPVYYWMCLEKKAGD